MPGGGVHLAPQGRSGAAQAPRPPPAVPASSAFGPMETRARPTSRGRARCVAVRMGWQREQTAAGPRAGACRLQRHALGDAALPRRGKGQAAGVRDRRCLPLRARSASELARLILEASRERTEGRGALPIRYGRQARGVEGKRATIYAGRISKTPQAANPCSWACRRLRVQPPQAERIAACLPPARGADRRQLRANGPLAADTVGPSAPWRRAPTPRAGGGRAAFGSDGAAAGADGGRPTSRGLPPAKACVGRRCLAPQGQGALPVCGVDAVCPCGAKALQSWRA